MEQHPVPQHIASFEFKLFGNLTIHQFVTLAIPMSVALLVYFSPLPAFIRLPIAIIFGGFGLFAALVPIQGRPFDKWIVAFTKAVLSPTQRVWVKETTVPQFLDILTEEPRVSETAPEPITFQDRQRLTSYLNSLPKATVSPLDVRERAAIARLGLTQETPMGGKLPPTILWAGQQAARTPKITQNQPGVAEETFLGIMSQALPQIATPQMRQTVKISPHAKPFALSGLEKKLTKRQATLAPQVQLASDTNFSVENIIPIHTKGKGIRLLRGLTKARTRKLHFAPPKDFNLANMPIRGEARFEVSEELKKRFLFNEPLLEPMQKEVPAATQPKAQIVLPPKPETQKVEGIPQARSFIPKAQSLNFTAQNASLKVQEPESIDSKITIQGKDVSAQSKPAEILSRAQIIPLTNTPNVLSGLITDVTGTPLSAAIITVRDQSGIPVRALKTNRLGQFLSATPLSKGFYTLEIEHDNAQFDPITATLEDQIMQPLEIRAKG